MSTTQIDLAEQVRALGREILPAIPGSIGLYTPAHESEPYAGVEVTRDAKYGLHERHRLDVFRTSDKQAGKPVFVFVHGGGFVGGDKKQPGSPYQDNVALWAARHGMVGVNITYRLAPDFVFPSGSEDLASAVGWLRDNIAGQGGDPDRIFVLGTSAGAVHVANFLAHDQFSVARKGVAGGIMLSGVYDLESITLDGMGAVYFGEDRARHTQMSSLPGLLKSPIPLLFGLAEFEPKMFEQQALKLIEAWFAKHGQWPNFIRMMGHNHLTATLHLNTADDYLGRVMLNFAGRA